MALISLPWSYSYDWGSPGGDSGSKISLEYTDTRSALQKTPRGKWRPPKPYNRTITQGATRAFLATLRVDAKFLGNNKTGYTTYAGPVRGSNPAGYSYALPAFPSSLTSRCERKALNKVKQQNVNLAVAFGERAACANMVANTATKLAKALRAARKLDVKGVGSALGVSQIKRWSPKRGHSRDKQASNLWLEYQYGWNPMYSDVYGSVEELVRNDNRFANRYRCHTTARAESKVDYDTNTVYTVNSGVPLQGDLRLNTRERHRTYVRLDWELENPFLASMAELGITNPALVAWELVPFSFVADWFVPIGSYLSSLDATVGWRFLGGSASEITRGRRRVDHVSPPRISSINYVNQSGIAYGRTDGVQTHMRLTRSVYGSAPFPWLPSIDGDLTKGHRAANAIALLRAVF